MNVLIGVINTFPFLMGVVSAVSILLLPGFTRIINFLDTSDDSSPSPPPLRDDGTGSTSNPPDTAIDPNEHFIPSEFES